MATLGEESLSKDPPVVLASQSSCLRCFGDHKMQRRREGEGTRGGGGDLGKKRGGARRTIMLQGGIVGRKESVFTRRLMMW